MKCFNKNIPNRSEKEWREVNEEKLKQWFKDNKEHLNLYDICRRKIKFECECGSKYVKKETIKHLTTKKHVKFLEGKKTTVLEIFI